MEPRSQYLIGARRIPTPLVESAERRRIELVEPRRRSRIEGIRIGFGLGAWWARRTFDAMRGRPADAGSARSLCRILQGIGGLFVKAGQLLSLRTDIFPKDFCAVLAELQFRVVGFPVETARRIIEEELGRPIEEVFDVFEDDPIAAASIAQVHRARLRREQVWVAVKVLRPSIAEDFVRDLALLRRLIRWFRTVRSAENFSFDEMLWELEQVAMEEVDYRYEAHHMRRMRRNLRRHQIRVPKVFPSSTGRLLVMEFLPGVLMSDILAIGQSDPERLDRWLAENDVSLEKIGRRLYHSFQRQVSEDNLFHGDLHPGNILVFRGNRLALIDLGSIGSLDPETRELMALFNRAIGDRNFVAAADYNLLLAGSLPRIDAELFRTETARVYRSWHERSRIEGLPYHEKSFATAGIEASQLIAKYQVQVSWQFLRVNRASVTLEASLSFLIRDSDQSKLLADYLAAAEKRALEALPRRVRETAAWARHELDFASSLQARSDMSKARAFRDAASKFHGSVAFVFSVGERLALISLLAIAILFFVPRAEAVAIPTRLLVAGAALASFFVLRRLRRQFALP